MATQISRKTAELMAKKLRAKLDALYADQESHPSKQQGGNNQVFRKGGEFPDQYIPSLNVYGQRPVPPPGQYGDRSMESMVASPDPSTLYNPNINFPSNTMYNGDYSSSPTNIVNRRTNTPLAGPYTPNSRREGRDLQSVIDMYGNNAIQLNSNSKSAFDYNSMAGIEEPVQQNTQGFNADPRQGYGVENYSDPNPTQDNYTGYAGANAPGLGAPQGYGQGLNLKSGVAPKGANGQSQYNDPNSQGGGNGMDWAGIAGGIASFAPGLYNLANAFRKPEVERPQDYYNPQYNNAMSLMRNRRFDVRPLLEQNQMNQNTYNRNIRNTASSRGELLSNMGGGYANRLRSDSAAYTQKSQMDAGYRGEEAQMRAQLGQQRAQTNMQVGDWNARNRAAQRNYGAAAAGNIGDASSLLLRNRNMKSADAMRTEAMAAAFPYLKEWMPGIEEMMKHLNTQKNGK